MPAYQVTYKNASVTVPNTNYWTLMAAIKTLGLHQHFITTGTKMIQLMPSLYTPAGQTYSLYAREATGYWYYGYITVQQLETTGGAQ
jgi:hypothetical protein